MRLFVAFFLWFVAVACLAQGGYAYRWVHADGSVTYSDTPPPAGETVERLNVSSETTEVEQQGQERLKQLGTLNKQTDEARSEQVKARREREEKLAQARAEVANAERALADTRSSKKSATPERIKLMENQLKLARQRLREVQAGVR